MHHKSLNSKNYRTALTKLASTDKDLKSVLDLHGPPPMWSRDPGFPTLIYIVLEQQVSLASARATFERLNNYLSEFIPNNYLKLDDLTLRKIGFSHQKATYCRNIAIAVEEGLLQIDQFEQMTDEKIRSELQKIKGIGPWTADIYLLMAMNRPDIWPMGDLALISALRKVKNLPRRPTTEEFNLFGEPWKPWRAVAARILWHYYVSSG
jgi:DNA-3-methyladenine glycosylase II